MWKPRQQSEWARAGTIAAAANTAFGGNFNPLKFIPPAFWPDAEPAREKTADEVASESKRAWAILDRVFGKAR